ncbi:hypothetical protein GPECTOR_79g135 [Gonium pectorale]|uniref:Uncharacterized protein n=1 Tax=Gonium pectorale TaxID=33097 RepID=A0A150G1V4_GONPE|nr:hypothetical protein GPECTOR_79g135 [Gonium pectorale]|eukprot:KXZ43856.1 hypothetical protein GPECTOR_79g135 [Gonium pectorale]
MLRGRSFNSAQASAAPDAVTVVTVQPKGAPKPPSSSGELRPPSASSVIDPSSSLARVPSSSGVAAATQTGDSGGLTRRPSWSIHGNVIAPEPSAGNSQINSSSANGRGLTRRPSWSIHGNAIAPEPSAGNAPSINNNNSGERPSSRGRLRSFFSRQPSQRKSEGGLLDQPLVGALEKRRSHQGQSILDGAFEDGEERHAAASVGGARPPSGLLKRTASALLSWARRGDEVVPAEP